MVDNLKSQESMSTSSNANKPQVTWVFCLSNFTSTKEATSMLTTHKESGLFQHYPH
jgi:hypothetical protein